MPMNLCGKYLLGLENAVGQISRWQVGSGQEKDQVSKNMQITVRVVPSPMGAVASLEGAGIMGTSGRRLMV